MKMRDCRLAAPDMAAVRLHANSHFRGCRGGPELDIEISLESVETRGDRFGSRKFGGDGVGGLQAVAGDADDGRFVRLDAILPDELLRDAGGHAARGFGEDAFGFGEELDGGDDLGIGDVLGPAAGLTNLFYREGAVGRIADGERARDRIGLLRLEASE